MADHDPELVQIGGDDVGKFEDGDALVDQLHKRAAYIGLSYGVIDELAGFPEGGTRKYLAPLRVRQLTIPSLLRLTEALGLKALLYVDPKLVAKMAPAWGKAR
jgi:hypothetical protein